VARKHIIDGRKDEASGLPARREIHYGEARAWQGTAHRSGALKRLSKVEGDVLTLKTSSRPTRHNFGPIGPKICHDTKSNRLPNFLPSQQTQKSKSLARLDKQMPAGHPTFTVPLKTPEKSHAVFYKFFVRSDKNL